MVDTRRSPSGKLISLVGPAPADPGDDGKLAEAQGGGLIYRTVLPVDPGDDDKVAQASGGEIVYTIGTEGQALAVNAAIAAVWGNDVAIGEPALTAFAGGGGTVNMDWRTNRIQRVNLTANTTLGMTAPDGPREGLSLYINHVNVTTVPSFTPTVLFPGGVTPSWSVGAGDLDLLVLNFDGTNFSLQSFQAALA